MNYVVSNPLMTESSYSYKGVGGSCKYSKSSGSGVLTGSGYAMVGAKNANNLINALNTAPVSVCIEADKAVFQNYKSGIIGASSGCGQNIDHAVLAVGYGDNYWIVKNSWGTTWGEAGYVRMAKSAGETGLGTCGILYQPVLAVDN
jgi:hypothetical protein